METKKELRKVYYRRYEKPRHFYPAPGYNCPKIPLGPIGCKGPDYEAVRVVKSMGCNLSSRRVIISWGLNIPASKWPKLKQVIALPFNNGSDAQVAEIMLAVD